MLCMSFDSHADSGTLTAASAPDRARDLAELAIGYALILAVIWTERPWQRWLYWIAAAYHIVTLCASRPSLREMGLRPARPFRSLWIVLVALGAGAIAVLIAARMGTLAWPGGISAFTHRYAGYAIWAAGQQVLLQDFFLLRLLRWTPSRRAAVLTASTIFCLAHLPNPILTAVTLIWGLASCLLFLRYRNLYPLAIAHAALGIAIGMTVPGPVIRNMRVGLGYLMYPRHHFHAPHRRS